MIIKEDLGIYTDIYDTGKIYRNTRKHLYHAKCKICGEEVERLLDDIRHSKQCHHKKQHLINGYVDIYLPSHHLARSNGFVYEHLIVAEEILNRPLKEGEVVHHKNHKRNDNRKENIMVFISNADHSRFHKTGIAIVNDDGTYYSPIQNKCMDCGKIINHKAKRCIECYKKHNSSHIPSKEILEELLKNNSLSAIGRMYNVSGNAVKRWKTKYNL